MHRNWLHGVGSVALPAVGHAQVLATPFGCAGLSASRPPGGLWRPDCHGNCDAASGCEPRPISIGSDVWYRCQCHNPENNTWVSGGPGASCDMWVRHTTDPVTSTPWCTPKDCVLTCREAVITGDEAICPCAN